MALRFTAKKCRKLSAFFCSKSQRHLILDRRNYRQSKRGNSRERSRLRAVSIRSTECPENKSRPHLAQMPTSTILQRALAQGLERAHAEGLLTWAFGQDADVICFQDTRCSEYSLPSNDFFPENYHAYFADNYDDPKLNGVAIYCKKMPKAFGIFLQ